MLKSISDHFSTFVRFRGDILTPKTVSYTMIYSKIDFPVLEVQKSIELQAFTIGFACRFLFLEKSKMQNICSGGGYRGVSSTRFRKDGNRKRENHDFSEYMIFVRAGRAKISSAALFAKTRNSQKTPKHGVYIYVWEDFCDFAFLHKNQCKIPL